MWHWGKSKYACVRADTSKAGEVDTGMDGTFVPGGIPGILAAF